MTSSQKSIPNPYLHANRWSRLFHSWIAELFDISQKRKTLDLTDLYDLPSEYESTQLSDKLENNWFDELRSHSNEPSILRATVRTMRWRPLLIGCLFILKKVAVIIQPILVIFLMDFFEPCSTVPISYACFLAFLIVLSTIWASFFHHQFHFLMEMFAMQMRIAYQGLIYRKVLRLSTYALNTFSPGKTTNIFWNDATQIEMAINNINYLWTVPIDIIVIIIFFWHFVKYVAFVTVGYTIILVVLIAIIGRLLVYFRCKILEVTDQRVKLMSEIVQSMRIVKMYCWERAFERRIGQIRRREIIRLAVRIILDSIQLAFSHTYVCISFLLMYGTMWSFNIHFDTRIFALASCVLSYLEVSLIGFGASIRTLVNYLMAAKRIQVFLLLDECQRDYRLSATPNQLDTINSLSLQSMKLEETTNDDWFLEQTQKLECHLDEARWQEDGSCVLKNIHFDAQPGDLICIIGPVGAGKSSLLQSLSGEIPFFDGKIQLQGSVCYVPQEPWIFSSTIKKNILFGKDYNPQLFRRIVRATALDTDFTQLSNGANTIVGDQGVMLSGGQKARVNMARALYRDADIYLLDDPLSAVDVNVSKHIFERSIKDYLSDRICILVTHQIQFIQDATRIIVLKDGEMVETGTYEDLLSTSLAFRGLLENIHQQAQVPDETIVDKQQRRLTRCMTVSDVDQEETSLMESDNVETKQQGVIKWQIYFEYLQAGAGPIFGTLVLLLIFSCHEVIYIFYRCWLAKWSDEENQRHRLSDNCTLGINEKITRIRSMNEIEWNIYRKNQFYVYCGLALVLSILSLVRIVTIKLMCLNSSRTLHNRMFQRLIRAPISFFDLNPVGRILNRFTKDISVIDEYISWSSFDFLECLFLVLGVLGLVGWLNPWSLIPAAIVTSGMLCIRHRFARCSRDLKRLENTSRSPVYSYLSSTIRGLQVIRSYRAEKICLSKYFSLLDDNTRANYLFLTTNRWAAIRLDWTTVVFTAIVTALALFVRVVGQHFSAADIALTLSYSLSLTGLIQWTVRQSVELESQMTSVERVLEYCQLDQERSAQISPKFQPPSHWPSHGQITYNNVCISYSEEPNAPLALSHITLSIRSAEKIGIVGRTGAGKSSFIQTLFRMGTLTDGQIKIDDIDIATIGLDDLRRRISIIPQDPVLFTGTMRSNLDQFGDYSDVEIWHALEQVQLKKLVNEVLSHGLQSLVSESGSNLSVGQKQLVCLARAILKKSKILVIDEATANVDNETDELIQRSIREQFRECTVLTVAHRLRTVIDSDRIMVLGDGHLLEFDTPEALLSKTDSRFSILVEQTGTNEAEHLRLLTSLRNHKRQ